MVDAEHLDILKQGTDSWNQWRQLHPKVLPALSGAQLHGMDLSGANLQSADLSGANLQEANLRRANLAKARLPKADLRWANLHEALLREARLRQADLSGAHLREADLSGAHLREADLSGSNLGSANLSMADLRSTRLCEAHLNEAQLLVARLRQTDLREADLRQANLRGARLRQANLQGANLQEANLRWTSFSTANLRDTRLAQADLRWANLSMADLRDARLAEADLRGANLRGANLCGANLMNARLVETNFEEANIDGCAIYGISAWELKLQGANQINLRISPDDEPAIVVDNLEVAQFIYLQLHNTYISEIIGTVGKKVVLILGWFPNERQDILEAVRQVLRQWDYLPLLLEMPPSGPQANPKTVSLLAHLARFVIVDLTDSKPVLDTADAIVRDVAVPMQLIGRKFARLHSADPLRQLDQPPSLLSMYRYTDANDIRASLHTQFLLPAEARAKELLTLQTP